MDIDTTTSRAYQYPTIDISQRTAAGGGLHPRPVNPIDLPGLSSSVHSIVEASVAAMKMVMRTANATCPFFLFCFCAHQHKMQNTKYTCSKTYVVNTTVLLYFEVVVLIAANFEGVGNSINSHTVVELW